MPGPSHTLGATSIGSQVSWQVHKSMGQAHNGTPAVRLDAD